MHKYILTNTILYTQHLKYIQPEIYHTPMAADTANAKDLKNGHDDEICFVATERGRTKFEVAVDISNDVTEKKINKIQDH